MSIYVGSTNIGDDKIWVGETTTQTFSYDFTQSDGGWSINGATISRSSNGFYNTGYNVDGYITPPSEIYNNTPKKIQIIFNRPDNDPGTGIYSGNSNYWYFLPRSYTSSTFDWNYNGTITQNNISFGTGDITWEMDIDSSTTNWTVTHKITGNSDIIDTGGVLKYLWNNNAFGVRLVHRNSNGTGPYIKKVTIEETVQLKNPTSVYLGSTKVRPAGDSPLVLKQIFDFSTNDWKGYTMTPTQGYGVVINTSGGYCEGAGIDSSYNNGNGYVWKEINAKRFWGRIKFMHPNADHGGVMIGTYLPSSNEKLQAIGDYADSNEISIGVKGTELIKASYNIQYNTLYYLDAKFENGLYTCILSDSNLNPLKTISSQTQDTTWYYSGFGGRGGSSQKTTRRIYEYREAYDNN